MGLRPSATTRRSSRGIARPATRQAACGIGIAAVLLLAAAPGRAALTEPARLAAVYDSILAAQFPRAAAQLHETCPPAPEPACKVLGAVLLWWQILQDPESRTLDGPFTAAVDEAIAAAAAWTRREPANAEAWFYLGGSYAPRVQWRALRGERIAAARDGKTIKEALERTIALDADLHDAYFGIGLYHYYADVAPAYAKLLRWLLLLPGGDREKGLQEMLRARAHGEILAGEADFQLQQIYLWYERRPRDAIALLESLDARYPTNPVFLERIADAYDVYLHDLDASAARWRELRDRARSDAVTSAPRVEAIADQKLRAIDTRRSKLF